MSEFTQNKSVTSAKYIKHQHDWQIEDYMYCNYEKKELISTPFTIPDYGEEEWHIELIHSNGRCPFDDYEEGLCLVLDAEPKRLLLDLTLSVITDEKSSVVVNTLEFLAKINGHQRTSDIYDFGHLITHPPADTFTIRCEIMLMTEIENIALIKDEIKIQRRDYFDDLEQLYNDDTTADVTLTVQNTTVHAHKAILMARSPFFDAMFRNNMKESITNNVNIENLDADILKEIIRFIYTDKVTNLEDKAFQLLDAAEKYDLQKLKVMCEESINKHISVANAAEILVIADRHRAHQLKTQIFHFIKSHLAKVVETEGYKNLDQHHPKLTLETFKAIVSS